jgi:hypothetical protein
MASEGGSPAGFTPLGRASASRRVLALVVGPLLWLAAVLVLGVVARRVDAIEFGLLVTAIAFVFSLVVSLLAWRRRRREEREAVRA